MAATGHALTALLKTLSEGVCLIDGNGRISAANTRFAELLELSADAFHAGANARELTRDPVLAKLMAKAPAKPLSVQIKTPEGRLLEARASTDDAGGHLIVLADISDVSRLR